MRKATFNVALGGVISALCLALEFSVGFMPVFLYVFPMVCSFLMYILMYECGRRTAVSAYVAISILSLLLCSDKEAAMMFLMFFGYYPMIRPIIADRIKSKRLGEVLKQVLFSASMVLAYLIIVFIFGISETEISIMWIMLLAVGNVVFRLYDMLLDRLMNLYERKLRRRFFSGKNRR